MKVLIIKTDALITKELKDEYLDQVAEDMSNGIVLLDGTTNYEVVDVDFAGVEVSTLRSDGDIIDRKVYRVYGGDS